ADVRQPVDSLWQGVGHLLRTPVSSALRRRASRLFVPNVVVDVNVVLTRTVPRIVTAHPTRHQLAELRRICVPQPDRAAQCRFDAGVIWVLEHVAVALA